MIMSLANLTKPSSIFFIEEVEMGVVESKPDGGAYGDVDRVYTPASGWLERDPAIEFDDMITNVAG